MARKRKRSKGSKKSAPAEDTLSSADGSEVQEEPPAEEADADVVILEVDHDAIGIDEADDAALGAVLDPDVETVDISLEEDVEDHETRERLIAEALAFVAGEEGEPPTGAVSEPTPEPETRGRATQADASRSAEPTEDPDPDRVAAPRISVDALLALSEMRSQGIALPAELVLDLGDATTEEERDRLLAAAMAHAEMQEAIYRIPTADRRSARIKAGIAAVLLLLAVIVGVWPPNLLVPDPPPFLTEADVERGLRIAIMLQAQAVEAYRVDAERLPDRLEDVAVRFDGIRYVRSSNRLFQLVGFASTGEAIVYDSADPAPEFAALARAWFGAEGGS